MRKLFFAIVVSTGAAACAEVVNDPPSELEGMPVPPEDTRDNDDTDLIEHPVFAAAETPSQCDMLPADDSACAHACDPEALSAFIPPGTCVIFDCPLTDGTHVRVGGCSP